MLLNVLFVLVLVSVIAPLAIYKLSGNKNGKTYLILNINKGVDYMCNNTEVNNCENCIADILKVILILQERTCGNDSCLQTCDRAFLGQGNTFISNTRPIVLYTCSNTETPLAMPISRDPTVTTTSTVFRIEKLDGCCATFRVLSPSEAGATYPYTATNSFFTINTNCVCVLRCLDDTFVETTL